MRIAVCDDETAQIQLICHWIEAICALQAKKIELLPFTDYKKFLAYAARTFIDIAFLDIYMDKSNGIDAARVLRRFNQTCAIIFVTSSPDHALEAFEVQASHYLIKPVTEANMREALQRTPLLAAKEKSLSIIAHYLPMEIPLHEILYITVEGHDTRIYLQNGTSQLTHTPLTRIREMLDSDPRFLTCQRNTLINADAIHHFTNDSILLNDGSTFAIPKKRYTELFNCYHQYLFRKVRQGSAGWRL